MADLPELYFRVRENGAAVFRLQTNGRDRRLELVQIAVANIRNDQIRPHGDRPPTTEEEAAIRAWMAARKATLAARELDDIRRAIDHLNHVAHWAQSRASDAEIASLADPLLLAMHDLRTVLVRRKAEALARRDAPGDDG